MSSILKDFVTVRKNTGDILNPAQYRSAVATILGIINRYDFTGLTKSYQQLLAHLTNYNAPHDDTKLSYIAEIVERVYVIYLNMTPTPLSLDDFKTTIVPSLDFLELIRRIVLNGYLYNQVKTLDGRVPNQASVQLSEDWGVVGVQTSPITLTFGPNVNSETDFIRLGWGNNTTPFPVIFTALDLGETKDNLPVLFDASSESAFIASSDVGMGYPIPIKVTSNDFTISIQLVGRPAVDTTLFSLRNGVDVFKINFNQNGIASVILNSATVVTSGVPSTDGRLEVVISKQGYASVKTANNGVLDKQAGRFIFKHTKPFTNGLIGVGNESLMTPGFAIRELTVFRGHNDTVKPLEIEVPEGCVLITDNDGAYLCDLDGTPLMERKDILSGKSINVPEGYILLTDADGAILTDLDGAPLVDLKVIDPFSEYTLPTGMCFIIDSDGAPIVDSDGVPLMDYFLPVEPPVFYLVDDDGAYLTDDDLAFVVEFEYNFNAINYKFLVDDDGTYLEDDDGTLIMEVDYYFVVDSVDGSYITAQDGSLLIEPGEITP